MEKIKVSCKNCSKRTYNKKFCSLKCWGFFQRKRVGRKCEICNKSYETTLYQIRRGSKCCSKKCSMIRLNEYLKKNKKCFYSKEFQKEMCKRANGNGGRIAQKTLREKKVSAFYDPKIRKANIEKCRRLKKGFCFDKKIQSKAGLISIKKQRERKPYYFRNVPFDSMGEKEIAMNIYFQLGVELKEEHNCHKKVGNKEYDFFIFGVFVEFHPRSSFYDNRTEKEYYENRRKNLDINGYGDYKLLIIK